MNIFSPKYRRENGSMMKLLGASATLALVFQLMLAGFFSPGNASAQAADASLTVNKVVNGGPNVAADFALFVDGLPVVNGVATTTLSAGVHTVTETNLPGYTATFSGDCSASGEVTLSSGGTATCTITNTFATTTATTSSLTVNKVVSGGTNVAADFPLFIDGVLTVNGVATTTLGAGTFTITETNLPGYTATFSGDCNASGVVTLSATGTAECTITNTFATTTATTSSLTVTKVVNGGPNVAADFPLFINGATTTSGVATTTLGAGLFTITETNLPGYTATFSGDCNAVGVVNLALGDDLECTITNTFATSTATTSSLTVTKVVIGGISASSSFPLFVNGISVTNGVATTTLGAGTFTITETNLPGYTATFSGDCNASGVVTLSATGTATCTITNTFTTPSSGGGGGGGGGGGQTNRGIERAAAVTPPGTSIAGQGLGLNTFQTFFLPPGQVLGAQSPFRGQVLGAQSYVPGMPSTGAEPLGNKFPNSLPLALLGLTLLGGVGVIVTRFSSGVFSDRNQR